MLMGSNLSSGLVLPKQIAPTGGGVSDNLGMYVDLCRILHVSLLMLVRHAAHMWQGFLADASHLDEWTAHQKAGNQ